MLDNKHNDMVQFQKELDGQFLEIYEERSRGASKADSDVHGLLETLKNFKLFFPLHHLRSIGNDIKYEALPLMSKWVIGYNQMQGDLYTIVDIENIIEKILTGQFLTENRVIEGDDNIIYLRDKSITSLAVVTRSLNLSYSGNFKEMITSVENMDEDNNWGWIINDKESFWEIFQEKNMSKEEWSLINAIHSISSNKNNLKLYSIAELNEMTENKNNQDNYKHMVAALVGNLYVDESLSRPIISINVPKFVRYLLNLNTY